MRKIILSVSVILLSIGMATLVYFNQNKTKSEDVEIFSIKTNNCFTYEEDKIFSVELFISNQEDIIIYKEENYFQLVDEDTLFELECKDIFFQLETNLFGKRLFLYQFDFLIPYIELDYKLEEAYLNVENELYTASVFLGTFMVESIDYKWLSYNDLYADFNFKNNRKDFTGLVVYLPKEYENKKVNIIRGGDVLSGRLSLYWENENAKEKEKLGYEFLLKEGYYYIELQNSTGYYTRNMFFTLEIDKELYYLDNFTYDVGEISIMENLANLTQAKILEGR